VKVKAWFRLLGVIAVLGASLSLAAAATAVPLDRSFGQSGSVSLWSEPEKDAREFARSFAVAPDGGIYLLKARYPCQPRGRTCSQSVSLARLRPDGSPDLAFAKDGKLELPAVQAESESIAVDRRGGVLIASYEGGRLVVRRVAPEGVVDSSYGSGGRTSLPCLCDDPAVHLLPQPRGRILVAAMWTINGPAPRHRLTAAVVAYRLGSNGSLDESFGEEGLGSARIANATAPDNPIPLAGGGIAFAGEGGYYGGGPWAARIGPRGGFDRRAVKRLRWAVRAPRVKGREQRGRGPRQAARGVVGPLRRRRSARLRAQDPDRRQVGEALLATRDEAVAAAGRRCRRHSVGAFLRALAGPGTRRLVLRIRSLFRLARPSGSTPRRVRAGRSLPALPEPLRPARFAGRPAPLPRPGLSRRRLPHLLPAFAAALPFRAAAVSRCVGGAPRARSPSG
jgi:hypothetical protein